MSALLVPSPQVAQVLEQMNEASLRGEAFFFALDFELREALFDLRPLEQRAPRYFFSLPGYSTPSPRVEARRLDLIPTAEPLERYRERFAKVQAGLMHGDSFLVNLALRTPVTLEASLEEVYVASRADYRLLVPGRFVSFSPECFVRLEGERLSTYPMKGTIDARLPQAAERLRSDYKESCEHHTIVDLMRNDLSRVAERVRVERFKYLTELTTSRGPLLQMSSEVVGRIDRSALRLGDLLLELLPAGSISGAPKGATLELIRSAEGRPRGFYTGVWGYFDGERLDTAVLIRYLEYEAETGRYYYRSGGGITINSQAEDEWRECLQKIYIPQ
ncbi:aminodeoxychorismate synthase component I [Porphyromonas sp.]